MLQLRKSLRLLPKFLVCRNCSTVDVSIVDRARDKLRHLGDGEICLQFDHDVGLATVTIDNDAKKNALSGKLMVQLEEVVNELERWTEGKGVILRSVGNTFCSGGDLTTVREINNPADGLLMSSFMHNALTKFYELPFVTVTIVQGKAIGGGAELTTVTDFRSFTEAAEVAFVQARMGVMTGWGGGTRLVKLVGAKEALELLCTTKKIKVEDGKKLGFVDLTVDDASKLEETKSWLCKRIAYDHTVVQAMKRIVISARDRPLKKSLLDERNYFAPLWGGPANIKALAKNIKHK